MVLGKYNNNLPNKDRYIENVRNYNHKCMSSRKGTTWKHIT